MTQSVYLGSQVWSIQVVRHVQTHNLFEFLQYNIVERLPGVVTRLVVDVFHDLYFTRIESQVHALSV